MIPRRRSTATVRAAWTSIATAWSGRRWRAGISRASTAANAKGRSTGRRRPASIARRAGRFIRFPGPQFDSLKGRIGQRRSPPITSGSTSSTPSAWATMCRSRPATRTRRLLALVNGKFVTLRVPYPMGFYAKGLDGRIDDPKAGWKGRGLWTTTGNRTPFHMEGGKGTKPWSCTSSFAPIRWRSELSDCRFSDVGKLLWPDYSRPQFHGSRVAR